MSAVAAATPEGKAPVAWLVAGACGAFVAFLAALAYAPDLAAAANTGAHALSRSPVGYAAIVELLKRDGAAVAFNRLPDAEATLPADALVVLTPQATTEAADILAVAKRRRVLLVPPKWLAMPDPRNFARLARLGPLPLAPATLQARAVLAQQPGDGAAEVQAAPETGPLRISPAPDSRDVFPPADAGTISTPRFLTGPAVQPVLSDAKGRTLLAMARPSVDYVLADADLLNNQGVADLARARAAASLLEGLADGGPIVFDLSLAGVGAQRSVLKAMFEPPLAPATLAGLGLAGLLGMAAGSRFGAVRRRERVYAFGKRALADSAASLLALAGREPRLAGRYAAVVRAEAAEAFGLAAAAPEAIDATLDRIGEARGAAGWRGLVGEAGALRTNAGLMDWARRIAAWRTELMRGRG